MHEDDANGAEDSRSTGRIQSLTDRRTVLQGAAGLGLAALGAGAAEPAAATDEHEDDADDENDDSGADAETGAYPVGIQLWTLRGLEEPVTRTIERVGEAGYDGVEPFTIGEEDPCDVAQAVSDAGLDVAGFHVGLEDLEENFEETVETHTAWGVDTFVVAYLGPEYFDSREAVEETAQRLSDVAERLEERGLNFAYHNHDHEFVDLEDRTAWEVLVEETSDAVQFQVDIGWVAQGGYDPAAVITKYGDRIDSLHVKDMHLGGEEAEFAEIGEGDVNLEAAILAAHFTAEDVYLIFENDEPEDELASLENGIRVISEIQDRLTGQDLTLRE